MDSRRGVDFIGVTICFVVHDGHGKFLLQKRSKNCRDEQGTWDIGGGALEFGETWEEGVRREVMEELAVEAEEVKFLKAFNALRDNNGVKTHWIALAHAVKVDPDKVTINEKHKIDEISWFTTQDMPTPLHSKMMESVNAAKALKIIT